MNARGKFGEHERSVRVVRDVAENISSFLCDFVVVRLNLIDSPWQCVEQNGEYTY